MGKFVISKRANDEFQFNLKADNNQVILTSEGYTTRANCENGIKSVRENSGNDQSFDRKLASDGRPYFNLKAANFQVIGTSEMYESKGAMEKGIDSVKNNAKDAVVEVV